MNDSPDSALGRTSQPITFSHFILLCLHTMHRSPITSVDFRPWGVLPRINVWLVVRFILPALSDTERQGLGTLLHSSMINHSRRILGEIFQALGSVAFDSDPR